jgi:hypothetical protein
MPGADDLKPLDAAIQEIHVLHQAAERAAARIGAQVEDLTGREAGSGGVVADVAEALVERTEAMRADCERLSSLLGRTRAAIAATAGDDVPPAPEPPVAESSPEPKPKMSFQLPPNWRFWRRDRGEESPRPDLAPPRLPRPDYAAEGVGQVVGPSDADASTSVPVPEGVRLIATQMAVAGSSRSEIERRLQRQFGIVDAAAVLDEIFGSDSSMPIE